MKTIPVPLDGSALAAEIVPSVRMLARLLDARVHVLHVVSDQEIETLVTVGAGVLHEAGASVAPASQREVRVREMLCRRAEGDLEALAVGLRDDGLHVDIEANGGVPAATIVEVVEHLHADLIAMATHGYGGLKR